LRGALFAPKQSPYAFWGLLRLLRGLAMTTVTWRSAWKESHFSVLE